ncbi:MAG: hypothetical protein Fur0041_14190 [Bacteroidia bacterium]
MAHEERNDRNGDAGEIFSKPVKAGKRTYFFDVKATRGNDYYLTITESKKRFGDDGRFHYEKHKLFLYKEDFEKFIDGLQEAINFIRERKGTETSGFSSNGEAGMNHSPVATDINFEDLGNH